MTTVGELLHEGRARGLDRLDAQLLLAHHLGRARVWLIAHEDAAVDAERAAVVRRDIAARARGMPLAYLVGEREFHGLMLRVTPDVLVPRPDTEVLVDWALGLLAGELGRVVVPAVADLGTGSGAIALAVKHRCPRASVLALDASERALAVARDNARRLGLELETRSGNWLAGLGPRRFHLLLSNPPYIDGNDPHLSALHAEPVQALSPGLDGLCDLRTLIRQAPLHLHDDGWLLLEHGHMQAPAVDALLRSVGFDRVTTRPDLAGLPRCTGGCWRPTVTGASA